MVVWVTTAVATVDAHRRVATLHRVVKHVIRVRMANVVGADALDVQRLDIERARDADA